MNEELRNCLGEYIRAAMRKGRLDWEDLSFAVAETRFVPRQAATLSGDLRTLVAFAWVNAETTVANATEIARVTGRSIDDENCYIQRLIVRSMLIPNDSGGYSLSCLGRRQVAVFQRYAQQFCSISASANA